MVKKVGPYLRARGLTAAYGVISMYFLFMILDRVLSIAYGFNFQPYGSSYPMGFTVWGHMFNGSMVALGAWLSFVKVWDYVEGARYQWVFRTVVTILFFVPHALVTLSGDGPYLVSRGFGSIIPLHVAATGLFLATGGVISLRAFASAKQRAVFLWLLFLTFLFVHFIVYAPVFPEFRWT